MNKYIPTLLIGLDSYGAEMCTEISQYIAYHNPLIHSNILSSLTINNNSLTPSGIEIDSLKIEFENELLDSVFQNNYQKFLDKEEEISEQFNSIFDRIQSITVKDKLIQNEIEVDRPQVCIISTSFDTIGSSIIIPVIKILSKLRCRPSINLFIILPEFSFDKEISKKRYQRARSFACLTEIDSLCTEDIPFLLNMIYVIGQTNENGSVLKDFSELKSPFKDYIYRLIKGDILNDSSYNHIFQTSQGGSGKLNRYSSFGTSSLYYHSDKVVEALIANGKYVIIADLLKQNNENKIDANFLNSDIKRFLAQHEFYQISSKISRTETQSEIFVEFSPNTTTLEEDTTSDCFIEKIKAERKKYIEATFPSIISNLSKSKSRVEENLFKILGTEIKHYLDDSGKNISYSLSFLNNLLKRDIKFIDADALVQVENIDNVVNSVRNFYTEKIGVNIKQNENNEIGQKIKSKKKLSTERKKRIEILEDEKSTLNQDLTESVNLNEIEIILNAEMQDLKKLESEIKVLQRQYDEGSFEIEKLNKSLEDVNERKEIMNDELNKIESVTIDLEKPILENEQHLKTEGNSLSRIYEKKNKTLFRLIFLYPSIAILAVGIFIIAISHFNIWINILVVVTTVIFYGLWALIYYNLKIGRLLKETKNEINNLQIRRRRLFSEYVNNIQKYHATEFSHNLNSYAFSLVISLKDKIQALLKSLETFYMDLVKKSETYLDDWESLKKVQKSTFSKNILESEDIKKFFDRQIENVISFFRDRELGKLSIYFANYNNDPNNNSLDEKMEKYLLRVFKNESEYSLFRILFVEEVILSRISPLTNLKILWNSSSPFISLNESHMDNSELLCTAFIDELSGEFENKIKAMKSEVGVKNISFKSGSVKNQLSFVSTRVGFPLFQVSSVLEYQRDYDEFLKSNLEKDAPITNFFVAEKYKDYSFFPTEPQAGELSTYAVIFIGRACGIISANNGSFYFNYKEVANNLNQLKKYFYSVKGEDDLKNLVESIESIKLDSNLSTIRNLVHNYINKNPDQITKHEMSKVENFLNEINLV